MKSYPEIRLIIKPAGVEKAQLLAANEKEQQAGLRLYQKLHKEISNFSRRIRRKLNEGSE